MTLTTQLTISDAWAILRTRRELLEESLDTAAEIYDDTETVLRVADLVSDCDEKIRQILGQ